MIILGDHSCIIETAVKFGYAHMTVLDASSRSLRQDTGHAKAIDRFVHLEAGFKPFDQNRNSIIVWRYRYVLDLIATQASAGFFVLL